MNEIKKTKIAIIGAGPNGLASLLPFLDHKDRFEISVFVSGDSLFSEEVINLQNKLRNSTKDQQHYYWANKDNFESSLIPRKLFFGTTQVYEDKEKDIHIEKNIQFDVSHSIGGLSNVWGANVSPLSKNDLKKYYNKDYLVDEYNFITSKFPISGFRDDLDSEQSRKSNYNKASLRYCYQSNILQKKYEANFKIFNKDKIRMGFSKLAIKSDILDPYDKIITSGLEMYGCHNNNIFNSAFHYEKLGDSIKVYKNTLVTNIISKNNVIEVYYKNGVEDEKVKLYDKVIIAAGTIGTSKLALKLLHGFKIKKLIIKDSQKYFFLYFTFFRSKKNEEKSTIGLSQTIIQTEINGHTFHMQLYHSKLMIRDALKNIFGKRISNYIIILSSFLLSRIMIGVVYFPDEISHHMEINFKDKKFSLKKRNNKKFSKKYIFSIFCKLLKFTLKLKSLPLPIFIKSKIGISQHFGASLPPSEDSQLGSTSYDGKLYPYENIFISDSSSLSRIPATPPTFISMSNAFRISSNIVKNVKDIE
tara:strand:+ start:21234 stop:22823 length:1590 start_codon:yes stop_codon:yes gene_type:complete